MEAEARAVHHMLIDMGHYSMLHYGPTIRYGDWDDLSDVLNQQAFRLLLETDSECPQCEVGKLRCSAVRGGGAQNVPF